MAAGRDHAYRNKDGLEASAEADRKQGDEGGHGAERRRGIGHRRGTDARLHAELEETRTIAEEGDHPSDSSSDRQRGRDRGRTRDSGRRSRAEGAELRPARRHSRPRTPATERHRDEPGSDSDGQTGESPPLDLAERERKAEKATDETREPGNRKEREANALTKVTKSATEQKEPPESTKDLGPAKQVAEEKGPDKTPVAVAEETLDDEDKYSTGSEDYYEEVTEEVVEPDPNDWRQGRGGLVTRRTTRSTTKKRKYGKPGARKSGEHPSSKHTPTTASEKKQRDDENDAEKKSETTTSEADETFPPAQDIDDKETGTCPCCGSCWPSHMDESRMKANSRTKKNMATSLAPW
ncbi:hypothetical protein MTO96_048363 [Rhipicephalus appendiculatus]